jgi:hypothetical protein
MRTFKIALLSSCVLFFGATYANASSNTGNNMNKTVSLQRSHPTNCHDSAFYALTPPNIDARSGLMPAKSGYAPEGNGYLDIP